MVLLCLLDIVMEAIDHLVQKILIKLTSKNGDAPVRKL